MADLIVFRNGMIDASTIRYAEFSSGLFIVSRKDMSSVRLTPEQFEDLSEQIKRRYSPSVVTPSVVSTSSTSSADRVELVNQVELEKLYKKNEDLETCLKDAVVPKLEHAMVLIATIGAERDALKAQNASQMAQNNALSDEIAELKKRIVQATEVISDLVSK